MTKSARDGHGRPTRVDSRLFGILDRIRTSFWALPALLAIAAVSLARGALYLDRQGTLDSIPFHDWLYDGAPADARVLLSSLASSMITVMGVVFSVTIVALSFASSHQGPRLLRDFMRDRATQVVLGSFVAAFLFHMVILSAIHDSEQDAVPRFSISVALGVVALSLAILIYFFHHVAKTMHVDHVIGVVFHRLDDGIDRLFPLELDESSEPEPEPELRPHPPEARLGSRRSGYVQVIDFDLLLDLAEELELDVTCLVRPSDYVVEGGLLATASRTLDEDDLDRLRTGFVLGEQRTETQDVQHSIRELVEIALRALSPSLNDPFTAIACIDCLSAVMAKLARRSTPSHLVLEQGNGHVAFSGVTFEEAMETAWGQIVFHGASQRIILLRVFEALERIAPFVRRAAGRAALRDRAGALVELAEANGDEHAAELRARLERLALVSTLDEPARASG